jgi:hypothetical protein
METLTAFVRARAKWKERALAGLADKSDYLWRTHAPSVAAERAVRSVKEFSVKELGEAG